MLEKLLPEVVPRNDADSQFDYQDTVIEVVALAQEVEGEGFRDIRDSEVLDLLSPKDQLVRQRKSKRFQINMKDSIARRGFKFSTLKVN